MYPSRYPSGAVLHSNFDGIRRPRWSRCRLRCILRVRCLWRLQSLRVITHSLAFITYTPPDATSIIETPSWFGSSCYTLILDRLIVIYPAPPLALCLCERIPR